MDLNQMDLNQVVYFLKYESDLKVFFDTAANYYFHYQKLPSPNEVVRIKVVLAVSDFLEGQTPQSSDPLYLSAYQIAQSI
jgi:hypothetical protein